MSAEPSIRIEKGCPDDAELAALLAVVAGRAAARTEPHEPAPVRWIHPERRIAAVARHSWMVA
ncbi:acyl-CoA carboxylase epsilon subunit [Nocardia sp. alder85J]|uniref:acyl-CoA carboxylase epsilon subunit n=1 Tax=Nocardia sp. alder85J TaxID=2862949 RepID=UPI001CD30122|nr:acyl-CoA carboxylase epsilon subunit [Nocardia sp. alder85J]MCX4097597.1 acyl-CoA carboxylase epsilon subunit [Nocardia sp. alder85J]